MTAPRTVLYLSTSGQVGGAERCLLSLIAGLDPNRYGAHVLLGSPGPFTSLLESQAVEFSLLPMPAGLRRWSRSHANRGPGAKLALAAALPGYGLRLRHAVRTLQPAIVHSNGIKMHYLAALLPPRPPLVWHLHDFPPAPINRAALWSPPAWRWLSRRPRAAIANSQAVARAYAELCPTLASRLHCVPNGVNVAAMQTARAAGRGQRLRQAWGWGQGETVFGMVAVFAPWKGQEVFLRAARILLDRMPRARFVLVGDDIYDTRGHGARRTELEGLARQLGLGASVRFTGELQDVAAAYAALDTMVHASTRPEPFGRTLIESMACGTPVVAAAAGGPLEIVEPGISGLLTPPGDVNALADAMLRLGQDHGLRQRLAAAATDRVRRNYDESLIGSRVTAIYDSLSPGKPGART